MYSLASTYCKSNIWRIFIFGYFRPGQVWPRFCFARFSVTVYTGCSSTGRKFDAAEMGFSLGRPKFEWAEMGFSPGRPKWILALGGRNLNGPKVCRLAVSYRGYNAQRSFSIKYSKTCPNRTPSVQWNLSGNTGFRLVHCTGFGKPTFCCMLDTTHVELQYKVTWIKRTVELQYKVPRI